MPHLPQNHTAGPAGAGTPDIIDIGVNLGHRSFQADRSAVIERAFAAGVRTMIITGTNVAGSEEAVEIARAYPRKGSEMTIDVFGFC